MAAGNLDAAFFPALSALAESWGVPPSWPLAALYLESRFNPQAHRAGSSFWGLSQLNTDDVQRYAGDPNGYLNLAASEQLTLAIGPWYTKALRGITPRSPGVFYAVNLAPSNVGNGDSTNVLYATPSKEYTANKGLDANGDGAITIGDLDAFLYKLTTTGVEASTFKAALAQLDDTTPPYGGAPYSPAVVTGWSAGLPLAIGALVGVAGAALALRYIPTRTSRDSHARENPVNRDLLIAGGALTIGAVAATAALIMKSDPAGAKVLSKSMAVFPILDVPGANIHFTDDFGNARVGYTHKGTDVFAAEGTPIVAPEDGKLTFTNDGVPGPAGCPPPWSFHLQGRSGTFYFGTHLSAFTGGALGDSREVIAGEQIGEVGHGGNACGTAPHLHFETHVGGVAIDPFPALSAAQRLTEAVA